MMIRVSFEKYRADTCQYRDAVVKHGHIQSGDPPIGVQVKLEKTSENINTGHKCQL